jgi:hypothetical protein
VKAAAREPGDAERRAVARTPARPDVDEVSRERSARTMTSHTVMRLQSRAGNAAVARLVAQRTAASRRPAPGATPRHALASTQALASSSGVQRLADGGGPCPVPPVAPVAADPKADPKFAAVEGKVKGSAKDLKKHPSGQAEAKKARDAAQAPGDDKASQAKAAQADEMATAKPKGFDKAAFVAAVKQAIAKAAPKNLDEADKFGTSGKADAVKGEVMGKVTEGKEGSAKDVTEKTKQAPDPSVAKEKPVTPLKEQPAPQPPAVDGAKAMPGKAPSEQTDLRAGPCEVKKTMADAEVTEQHLTASNEPQMQQAAAAQQEADAHAAQAPAQIRQKEGEVLQQAQAGAGADAQAALTAMTGARGRAGGQVGGQQNTAKAKEERERARISGEINKIFDKTKGEVEAILTGLDAKVTQKFEQGEARARSEFTAMHKTEMERYKDERYSGPVGWARWTEDLFTSLPKEADKIFDRAKALYEEKMAVVISDVADLIGTELNTAKEKIAAGRQEIKNYVATQPRELQKLANDAATEISGKFDQLESDVDAKQESLVDDLAQKYTEARNAVDEEIKAEQEKNKGLVDKAKDMVGDSIQAIIKLKDLFLGLLARAASAFTSILKDPLGFIGRFMSAVKQGFMNFASRILEHLKKGLQGWLFGQLASAGIEIPDTLDAKGIIKMIASMLGLTWGSIKARIVAKAPWVGQAIDFIESKIEIFVILATQGVAGLWNWIKEKVGDIKEMVFGQIKTFVVERIVKAGITWVLGMLNPAGALIKIVQALISVVQWIMERGQQLGELIGSVIDAVRDIAGGGGGSVPEKIEGALGRAVPIVISFLASLLGLGGISEKIKSILEVVQQPVRKALDFVINGALKAAKPLIRAGKGLLDRGRAALARGKAFVRGQVDRAKAFGRRQLERGRTWLRGRAEAVRERLGLTRADRSFSMLHATHRLTFQPPNQLLMASWEGDLVAKVDARLAALVSPTASAAEKEALRGIRDAAVQLSTLATQQAPQARTDRQLTLIIRRLTRYGGAFRQSDLDTRPPAPVALPEAAALQVVLARNGMDPDKTRRIIDNLSVSGRSLIGPILRDNLCGIPNYGQVLSDMAAQGKLFSAGQAITEANRMIEAGYRVEFERKGSRTAASSRHFDADFVSLTQDGQMSTAFQLKAIELSAFKNQLPSSAKVLANAPARRKAIIIDILDAASRDFDRHVVALRALGNFQQAYPSYSLRVSFNQGPPKLVNWQGLA